MVGAQGIGGGDAGVYAQSHVGIADVGPILGARSMISSAAVRN